MRTCSTIMQTKVIADHIASLCIMFQKDQDILQKSQDAIDRVRRARQAINNLMTQEERNTLLNRCPSFSDELFRKSVFALTVPTLELEDITQ